MQQRLDYRTVAPKAYQAIGPLYSCVKECGLEKALLDLVWLRVSQINGCAYCVDLHYREGLAHGLAERKLNSVTVWQEAPFFSARERAALSWAETLTLVAETHAPDAAYDAVRAQFADKELVDLTHAIALMNMLNRLGVGFRRQPEISPEEQA